MPTLAAQTAQTPRSRRLRLNLEDTKFSICERWLLLGHMADAFVAHMNSQPLTLHGVQCLWCNRS